MSKLLFLFVVFAIAVATASQVTESKGIPNQYAKGALKHAKALSAQVQGEMERAKTRHEKFARYCKRTLRKHSANVQINRKNIAARVKTISTKTSSMSQNHRTVEMIGTSIEKLKKKMSKVSKLVAKEDHKRREARKEADEKVMHITREIAFVRSIYNELMSSTVERRRNVHFLQEKSHEMSERAKAVKNKAVSALMEVAAKEMATGHLNRIYSLLNKLRADMQENVRAIHRQEKRREKRYTAAQNKRRSWTIRLHRRVNRAVERLLEKKELINKAEERVIHCHVSIENSRLQVLFHTRDRDVLELRCKRRAAAFPKRVKSWLAELASLKVFTGKLSGYYKASATQKKILRK